MMSNAVNGVTCNACVKTQTKNAHTFSNCRTCVFPKQSQNLFRTEKALSLSAACIPKRMTHNGGNSKEKRNSNLWMKHNYKFAKRSPRDVTCRLRSKRIGRELELPYSVASHSHHRCSFTRTRRIDSASCSFAVYIFEMMSNAIIVFPKKSIVLDQLCVVYVWIFQHFYYFIHFGHSDAKNALHFEFRINENEILKKQNQILIYRSPLAAPECMINWAEIEVYIIVLSFAMNRLSFACRGNTSWSWQRTKKSKHANRKLICARSMY